MILRDFIAVSDFTFSELKRQNEANRPTLDQNPLLAEKVGTFSGITIAPNPIFPYDQICSHCGGTGEGGKDSTYCAKCKGAGKRSITGAIQQRGQLTVLVDYYPAAFAPSWPQDVKVPRRGITIRSDYPVQGAFQ